MESEPAPPSSAKCAIAVWKLDRDTNTATAAGAVASSSFLCLFFFSFCFFSFSCLLLLPASYRCWLLLLAVAAASSCRCRCCRRHSHECSSAIMFQVFFLQAREARASTKQAAMSLQGRKFHEQFSATGFNSIAEGLIPGFGLHQVSPMVPHCLFEPHLSGHDP